ncbi:MAG: choice-of-anchor Q domain-containing protein [Planctomycetaceae bacterium]
MLLKRGEQWAEQLVVAAPSEPAISGELTFGAYSEGADPVIGGVTIRRDNTIVEDLTIDQHKHDRPLFSADLRFRSTIVDERQIATAFREEFARHGLTVSPQAITRSERGPIKWVVRDYDNERKYALKFTDHGIEVMEMDDAVRLFSARRCELRDLTLRNGISDGIDADYADGLLGDSCLIHDFLAGSFAEQQDAHGIVVTHTQGVTIRNTEIHHVSGDCLQTDPYRTDPVTNDVLIENCHFWTGPLEEDFSENWRAGQRPGENAIDTKAAKDWENAGRMRLTIRNTVAHGWLKDDYISNKAAFNMKEKVDAVFDGVTVYDCELGFRLRGARGNAKVTILNAVIHDCEFAVRAEDNLRDLRIDNCTFGNQIGSIFRDAAMDRGNSTKVTWELRNNVFVGTPEPSSDLIALSDTAEETTLDPQGHALILDKSNKSAEDSEFLDAAAHDYRLQDGSRLIDAGVEIELVQTDRNGVTRPQGAACDAGAYEHTKTDSRESL